MVFAGMPGLRRLVYVSRQALAAASGDQLAGVVHDWAHHNRHHAVTGLLLSHKGWFIQVLEGPGQAVMETYRRIEADPRHDDLLLVSYERASGRLFADWDMCCQFLQDEDGAALARLGLDRDFDPRPLRAETLIALLGAVADRQRAALAA
jgi:hypothetical protein